MQTYANHRRFNPLHHYFAAPLAYTATVWSLVRLIRSPSADAIFFAVIGVGLGATALAARQQALIVQDRVIRLEMRLRLGRVLTPDLLDRAAALSARQLVALRFASDAELPDLVMRTLAGEFPRTRLIKQAIREWQPDTLRA